MSKVKAKHLPVLKEDLGRVQSEDAKRAIQQMVNKTEAVAAKDAQLSTLRQDLARVNSSAAKRAIRHAIDEIQTKADESRSIPRHYWVTWLVGSLLMVVVISITFGIFFSANDPSLNGQEDVHVSHTSNLLSY